MNQKNICQNKTKNYGFTVVELLVVIVVIAILAAIVIVSYNNIQQRATRSTLASELKQVAKRIELDKVDRGSYITSIALLPSGPSLSNSDIQYEYSTEDNGFCLSGILKGISSHISSASGYIPASGVCDGHADPNSPVVDPVMHTQTGRFEGRGQQNVALETNIVVDYAIQPTDYVFVLFNFKHSSRVMSFTDSSGSAISQLFTKSMGVSGYKMHIAYGFGGASGPQTLTLRTCYSSLANCHMSDTEGSYVVYVVRGLGANPTVTATSTDVYGSYSSIPVATQSPQVIRRGELAIYSYLGYMSNPLTLTDKSTPALSWSIDSSQTGNAGNSQSIAARHAFATSSTVTVDYQATMPTSGSRYYGAVLFTIKKP